MDKGTIGSSPAEVVLNQILMELDDRKISHKVMSRFHKLQRDFKKLEILKSENNHFHENIVNLLYKEHVKAFSVLENTLPKHVYTHAKCVYHTLYTRAIGK